MNFYDYISFPQKDIRDEVREKYFNTNNLRLNIDNLEHEHFLKKYDVNGVVYETMSGSVYEVITEFNNNISYLDIPLLEMYNYHYLMTNSKEKEETTTFEVLFRQRCRNLSCELFVYEEKIKNILRVVLNIKATKYDKSFYNTLNQVLENSDFGKKFKDIVEKFHADIIIEKLKIFRNDEVHNSSALLLYLTPNNEKENAKLFDNIKHYLQELLKVKEAFEEYLKSII